MMSIENQRNLAPIKTTTTLMKMTMLVMMMIKQTRSLAKESQSEEMATGTERGDKEIAVEAKSKRL